MGCVQSSLSSTHPHFPQLAHSSEEKILFKEDLS